MSHDHMGHIAWYHNLQCPASSQGKPASVTTEVPLYTQSFCQHLIAHSSWDDRAHVVSPIYTELFWQHLLAHGSWGDKAGLVSSVAS